MVHHFTRKESARPPPLNLSPPPPPPRRHPSTMANKLQPIRRRQMNRAISRWKANDRWWLITSSFPFNCVNAKTREKSALGSLPWKVGAGLNCPQTPSFLTNSLETDNNNNNSNNNNIVIIPKIKIQKFKRKITLIKDGKEQKENDDNNNFF